MISWQARLLNWYLKIRVRRAVGNRRPADFRRFIAKVDNRFNRIPAAVTWSEISLGEVPSRYVIPKNGKGEGTIFFLHGGAWCLETPNAHTALASRLALKLGMDAYIPSYRLAPEHPFPAGPDDCLAAWNALIESGVKPENVVLCGDSAGGALSLGLLGRLRDAGRPLPRCALLISPATDLAMMGRSVIVNESSDSMFLLGTMLQFRRWYLGDGNPSNPLASPYWGDFSEFPPLFFQVSGAEVLLDNSVLTEAKARSAGVKTELSIWPGMPHDFILFDFLPEAQKALHELVAFVQSRDVAVKVAADCYTPD